MEALRMDRPGRTSIALGGILVLVGILFAVLPKEWLENTFAIEPDAGNGLVELLLVAVPVVVGGALIARGCVAWQRETRQAEASTRKPHAG
jgi:hypothetical protein